MSNEKPNEKEVATSIRSVAQSVGAPFDAEATGKILRKMDWHLVPFLSFLYLLSFLDRTNIGNAKLANLEEDLGMSGLDYNIALAIFFPFYVLAEVPSNIMMKRTSPSLWIMIIMLAWGICTTLMGLVKNFTGLLVCRAALGIAEGGLFPGVTWYITLWYRRHECGLRTALFFSAATLAGAFGGLLARGIVEMDGVGNLPGWAWLFILEGILTFVVAGFAKWLITDSPEVATFLTQEERVEVTSRLKLDRGSLADEYDNKYIWAAFKDWKIWVHMVMTFGIYTPLYSVSLFLPTIVKGMGYSNAMSQLMSVPPYVAGCVVTILSGWWADRSGTRGPFMIAHNLIAILGFVCLIATDIPGVQFFGCFCTVCGIYPNVPLGVAWNGNNIGGSTKRAVGIAMHVGFGNLGGVLSSFAYRGTEGPRYYTGHGLLIGTTAMSTILGVIMHIYLRRENARRDDELRQRFGVTHDGPVDPSDYYTEEMREAEREKGDNASFFRYTI